MDPTPWQIWNRTLVPLEHFEKGKTLEGVLREPTAGDAHSADCRGLAPENNNFSYTNNPNARIYLLVIQ